MTTVRNAGTEERTEGVLSALLTRVQAVDLLVLAAVPAVLLGVFTLPEATRRSLAFQYTDPTLLSAFTAHYVHLEVGHLAANLVGYGLLAGVCYALAVLGRRRRLFVVSLATFLLAFPFVLSALNLAVPRHAIGYGFSGINMALLGLLPLVMAGYVRTQFFPAPAKSALPAVFFLVIGWIAYLALPVGTSGYGLVGTAVASTGVLLGAVYLFAVVGVRGLSLRPWIDAVTTRAGYGDLFVVGIVLLVAYPAVGFPANPTEGGSVLNLYVHLLGFCLAFIGPYAMLAAGFFEE